MNELIQTDHSHIIHNEPNDSIGSQTSFIINKMIEMDKEIIQSDDPLIVHNK